MSDSHLRTATLMVAGLLALGITGDASANSLPPIVFVSRDLPSLDVPADREQPAPVQRARHGELLIRGANGELRTLVDARLPGAPAETPVDVLTPEVSYDGLRIVFAGLSPVEDAWRIYEVAWDGTGLRQITRGDRRIDLGRFGPAAASFERYDDLDPCYLPDGRICFSSTRYPESVPEVRARATNLYVVNADGSDLHRITSERFGADGATVDPRTGKIIFSRWWRTPELDLSSPPVQNPDIPDDSPDDPRPIPPPLPPERPPIPPGSPGYGGDRVAVPPPPSPDDQPGQVPTAEVPPPSTFREAVIEGIEPAAFPGVNSWFLSSINPDGTELQMFSGFHLDRAATQAWMPSFHADGAESFALFLTHSPVYGVPGQFGLRRFDRGIGFPAFLGGPQQFGDEGNHGFFYSSVAGLPDGQVVVTGSRGPADAPGKIDLFMQENARGAPVHVLDRPETAEMDAVPLVARTRPPVIRDVNRTPMREEAPRDPAEAHEEGGTFTFLVENIFANAGVDVAIPNAPPFGKNLSIEFFMAPQRTSFPLADSPVLLKRVPIPATGRVEVELPAGVPLFEVLRRSDGTIPVGRDGQIFHVGGQNYGRAGGTGRCVGCHAGHSLMDVPADPARTNLAPSATASASSVKTLLENEFRPELLVDRRTDFFRSEWAALDSDPRPTVRLEWSVPVRIEEVVVYAAKSNRLGGAGVRDQIIRSVSVRTELLGEERQRATLARPVSSRGSRIGLDPSLEVEAVEVIIDDVDGRFEGGTGPALAEIEVIGTVVEGSVPTQHFIRGDANCDRRINLTDPVVVLDRLFRGGEPLCCDAAGDSNGDRRLNLTDPVFLLNFLFLGGPTPSAPFPECGQVVDRGLTCDTEACRGG